ncbi:hypothetical protein [Flavobacterium sp. T12S277]|uniref:P-loop NTPase n=1 Tax=Flavobacterium sp. T12S277 TaxID=3402752 RepID=UPI003AEF133A
MSSKLNYKITNVTAFAVQAFKDLKDKQASNTLNNARKSCEAMCRAILLQQFGEINGDKIILGEIDKNLRPINAINGKHQPPLLNELLKQTKNFISPQSIYFRCQDIRYGGNNASHDPINIKNEVSNEDVDLCIAQFKEILRWFWNSYLQRAFPQEIENAFNGIIGLEFIDGFGGQTWNDFYNETNFFSKDQKFILVSPPKLEGLTENQMGILGRINWHFIFDFDPTSQESGLYKILKDVYLNKEIKPINIEQNNPREKNIISNSNFALNWFFANGISSMPSTVSATDREWRQDLKYPLFIDKLIKEYFSNKLQNVIVVFLWDSITHIRPIFEKIAENSNPGWVKFLLVYDNALKLDRLEEEFSQYDVNLYNLKNLDIVHGISTTVATKNNSSDKLTVQIPSRGDQDRDVYKDINTERFYFEEKNIEILYVGIENQDEIVQAEDVFYKGGKITWKDIFDELDVKRFKTDELEFKIRKQLELSKGAYVVELFHRAGSGGTTLARNIAYKFHDKYPTIVISKYQRNKTKEAIFKLSEITQKPILAIIEAYQVNLNDRDALVREVNIDKKHIVILYVRRYFSAIREKTDNPKLVTITDNMADLAERKRFVSKYSSILPENEENVRKLENRPLNECEVIDFSLVNYENDFSQKSLEEYLLAYLNKLSANQLQFIGFTCLINYYTQQSTYEYWVANLFTSKSLTQDLLGIPYEERYIKKILIQEYNEEGEPTGYWKPRFDRFGKIILKLVLVGLNVEKIDTWKDYLAQWSVDFISICKDSTQILT